jgi:hypothetical protein
MIYTCYRGRNYDLISEVAKLYFTPGMRIADVTYGRGNFWRNIDINQYDFHPSDIMMESDPTGIDFRDLPYASNSFDVIVLDPPYVHSACSFRINATYNNKIIAGDFDTVLQLYCNGIQEARRVLKHKGLLLVKCQDIVEGRMQRWSHIILKNFAEKNRFKAIDLFVLHQNGVPIPRNTMGRQIHARRNHSYLWIFRLKKLKAEAAQDEMWNQITILDAMER